MARLAGIELQDNWRIDYALTRLKGIGWPLSKKVLNELSIKEDTRISALTKDELSQIANNIDKYSIEGELVRAVRANVQRLTQIGAYRGVRHHRGLPARGQRTRTNARTKRGKRKTVGAFKKEMLAKQTQAKTADGK